MQCTRYKTALLRASAGKLRPLGFIAGYFVAIPKGLSRNVERFRSLRIKMQIAGQTLGIVRKSRCVLSGLRRRTIFPDEKVPRKTGAGFKRFCGCGPQTSFHVCCTDTKIHPRRIIKAIPERNGCCVSFSVYHDI